MYVARALCEMTWDFPQTNFCYSYGSCRCCDEARLFATFLHLWGTSLPNSVFLTDLYGRVCKPELSYMDENRATKCLSLIMCVSKTVDRRYVYAINELASVTLILSIQSTIHTFILL